MKSVIGKKNKTYLIETIITTLLILSLIALCVYRIIRNENGITMLMVYIGLSAVCLYWLFVECKNIYKYLKTPKSIILYDEEFIYIYEFNTQSKILIKNIKEISVEGVINKLLAHEATLYIKDEENEYHVKLVKNVDEVKKQIEELIDAVLVH